MIRVTKMAADDNAVDVAVVGAGITGLSVAWHLRARGVAVRVLDRTGVGAGASGVQPGGVRQQWGTEVNCRLARESVAFHRDADERLESLVPLGFRACGYLFLAQSEGTLAHLRANVALQKDSGVPSRLVASEEAARLAPGLSVGTVLGAAWCGEDGFFDRPQAVVEAFARGTDVRIAEVRALDRQAGAWRLELGDGHRLVAPHVVVAAAEETASLLRPLGVDLPIAAEDRFLFLSRPLHERLLEPLVVAPEVRFAAKQLADGRVLASDLSAAGDPNDRDRQTRWRAAIRAAIRELLPALEYVEFPLLVHGRYDMTPDRQAIIGEVDDGLWVAAGFSGHGFMIAPAVGRMLAEAIAGAGADPALQALAPQRFAEGRSVPESQVV
jgi:sarcosine oxidase subunit beta